MTDNDSDLEFDKFLQESLSSSSSNISKKDEVKENQERATPIGLSWLKPSMDLTDNRDTDEWIDPPSDADSRPVNMKRKTSTTSLGDDPLNFSTGSGYSIISEIEHQLGLRGNKSMPSGQETLNEEDEKKNFFELLERGRGSSLDYSELNRQLDDSTCGSLRATDRLINTLNTIDEDVDITPHVSDSGEYSSSEQSLIPSSSSPHLTSKNILISSTSSTSTKVSPSHSHDISPGTSAQRLLPITDTPLISSITPRYNQRKVSIPSGALSTITIPTGVEQAIEPRNHIMKSATSSVSVSDMALPSPSVPIFHSQSDPSTKLHTNVLQSLSTRTANDNEAQDRLPSSQQAVTPQELKEVKGLQSNVPESTLSQYHQSHSMSSVHVPLQPKVVLSSDDTIPITTSTSTALSSVAQPVQSVSIATVLPSVQSSNDSLTCVPIAPSSIMSLPSSSSIPIGHSKQDRSLQDLLRALAVEELTTLSHDMMIKTGSNRDCVSPVHSPVRSPVHSPSTTAVDATLHQQIEQWKRTWEREKEKVKIMEDDIKECARKEERLQLEYGRQIQELRGELLEQRANLRRVEAEKAKSTLTTDTQEQERLIQGYQKENERLYKEMTLSNRDLKSTKARLLEDSNKLATELANMRAKLETQDDVIRHLRQQIDSSSSYHMLQLDTESDKRTDPHIKEKLQESYDNNMKLQKQVEELTQVNLGLERELITLKNERVTQRGVTESGTLSVKVIEMKQEYEKEILLLHGKLKKTSDSHESERRKSELLLQEKDYELKSLKESIAERKNDVSSQKRGHYLIKSRTGADCRRIKELEHQVNELQVAIKKRHPNSIPALIYATNDSSKDREEIVSYLEKKVQRLESELAGRQDQVALKMEDMKGQFHEMETLYEQQIDSLKKQVTEAQTSSTVTVNPCSDNSLQMQNTKLKEQISQLSLEVTHQRLQLEGIAAQAQGEQRKSCDKWQQKIKKMERDHAEKMDTVVANLIQERSESNVARLKSRLAAREARIKQLEEEIEILQVDGETLAVARSLEEDLHDKVEVLTYELEESKRHHTPEMHHFNCLLAKISHLENKLGEYQRKLQETKDKAGLVSQEQLKQLELKYRRQLSAKNKQIEKFREELDTLMDTLHSLQESTEVIGR